MRVTRSIAEVRDEVRRWRRARKRIDFVPTMGAIHAGHQSLVLRACAEADRVVASIFVNPLQFGPGEDYRRYPRSPAADRQLLARAGADLLWTPEVEHLVPAGHRTRIHVAELSEMLEGDSRPGHFDGVTTIVIQLLNVAQPDALWLGQKDAQQMRVIEQMVADLKLPTKVRRAPIVRERDGLALSSRNAYLGPEERRQAVALSRGLAATRMMMRQGERSSARLVAAIRWVWREFPLVQEDYVAVVDARTLAKVGVVRRRVLVAVAPRVGRARLIDNFEWGTP